MTRWFLSSIKHRSNHSRLQHHSCHPPILTPCIRPTVLSSTHVPLLLSMSWSFPKRNEFGLWVATYKKVLNKNGSRFDDAWTQPTEGLGIVIPLLPNKLRFSMLVVESLGIATNDYLVRFSRDDYQDWSGPLVVSSWGYKCTLLTHSTVHIKTAIFFNWDYR